MKLFAQRLGGTDFIGLNLYLLTAGTVLKPREMPEAKVRALVLAATI